MHSHHLFLFLLELHFIIQKMLSVTKVLDGPVVLFSVLVFLGQFLINNLASLSSNNIFDLFLSKSLEVIWHKSVTSQLRLGGLEVLGHDVTHVGSMDLKSVGSFLVVLPVLFSLSLLLSKLKVIVFHFLLLLSLSEVSLVFHETSHLSDCSSLCGIRLCLEFQALCLEFMLSLLLLDPILLHLSVLIHSCVVH